MPRPTHPLGITLHAPPIEMVEQLHLNIQTLQLAAGHSNSVPIFQLNHTVNK
jgi:hypothetical protein